jgi:hypothetical protein
MMSEINEKLKRVHSEFNKHIDGVLASNGFKKHSANNKSAVYIKHDQETNNIHTAKHHFGHYISSSDKHGNRITNGAELHIFSTNGANSQAYHNHINFLDAGPNGVKKELEKIVTKHLEKSKTKPPKQTSHLNEEKAMILTAKDAFKKILNEQVEQLDELSNDTLERYNAKAQGQINALKSKRGRKSADDLKTVDKRQAGIKKGSAIRSKRYADEHDVVSKKTHAAFKEAAHKVLTDHGYELTHPGKASNIYTKHDVDTNTLHMAKHHIGHPATQDSHHYHEGEIKLVSSNGTTSNVRNKGGFSTKMELRRDPNLDLVAHHAKEIDDEVKRHHKWSDDSIFNRHLNEDVEQDITESFKVGDIVTHEGSGPMHIHSINTFPGSSKPQALVGAKPKGKGRGIRHVFVNELKPYSVKEDVEQLDELSRKTLGSYIKKASGNMADKAVEYGSVSAKRDEVDRTLNRNDLSRDDKNAFRKATKTTFDDMSKPQRQMMKRYKGINKAATKLAKEEVEILDEGRGRPRKDGTSAVGADREHIMMQLRKHVSLNGANPIEFKDGSKHKISTGEARLAQMIHSGLRTSIEKGNFEKKLDHSHDSFKEALAKKDEAGKGKEKPGITLPALQRINRLKFASGE